MTHKSYGNGLIPRERMLCLNLLLPPDLDPPQNLQSVARHFSIDSKRQQQTLSRHCCWEKKSLFQGFHIRIHYLLRPLVLSGGPTPILPHFPALPQRQRGHGNTTSLTWTLRGLTGTTGRNRRRSSFTWSLSHESSLFSAAPTCHSDETLDSKWTYCTVCQSYARRRRPRCFSACSGEIEKM